MRNLKRALSLAMASVMLLGMMVVGTGASYKDVTSEQNQEAIEVLQAAGVMVGDEKGNFNPDQNVTRNEMAVIMANLMDYRVASYSGTSPFTDVPSWAEPYVAACYTNGITSGMSATTYGGDQTVTTSQAALMLMKALGYFQYQSDFENDWQLATVKQANLIDLFDGVKSGVREAMTRNDVAQLVLNTLKAGTVQADDDTIKVEADGVTVEAGKVSYEYITSGLDYAKAIDGSLYTGSGAAGTSTNGSIVQLGEKLYQGDLKLRDATNGFGAPANKWTYKNVEVGTYAEAADYTFAGAVKSQDMYDTVGKDVAKNYTWEVYVDGDNTESRNGTKDGAKDFQDQVLEDDKDDLKATGRGTTTYVYVDDSKVVGQNVVPTVTVCIVNTYVAEITKVEDGTITLDDDDMEFDIEGYDEEDVVLFTKSNTDCTATSGWTVEAIMGLAERVEGEATTIRVDDRVVVDDTTYKYSNKFNDANGDKLGIESVDQKVAFYLDAQGNIIMIDDAVESNDYAYVYSVGKASDQFGGDDVFGAKLILTDGTSVNVTLDSDDTDPIAPADDPTTSNSDVSKLGGVRAAFVGQLVSYSVDDNEYSIDVVTSDVSNFSTTKEDAIKNGAARVYLKGSSSIYADKNTAFLINDASDDNDDFNAYVGYNNVPNVDADSNTKIIAYVNSKGVAKAIVVVDGAVSGSSNDVIFVIGNNNPADGKVQGTGSNKYYVYDAVVNGEATSIAVKYDTSADSAFDKVKELSKGEIGVFFGMTENSSGYVTKLTSKTPSDVAVNNQVDNTSTGHGEFTAWVGTKRVSSGGNLTFNTANSAISLASNDDAVIAYYDGSDLEIASSVKTDDNDQAYVVTDDGVIIAIFVFEK